MTFKKKDIMTIVPCKNLAIKESPAVRQMCVLIDAFAIRTAVQFDEKVKEFNEYLAATNKAPLNFTLCGRINWTVLGVAAFVGNVALIERIVQVGGKHLLELGGRDSETPLFSAIMAEAGNRYQAVAKLIELGANVNTSLPDKELPETGQVSLGKTPLYAAVSQVMKKNTAESLAVVQLLLRQKALVQPALDKEGQRVINLAQQKIKEEDEKGALAIKAAMEASCTPLGFEKGVSAIIQGYARTFDPPNYPEILPTNAELREAAKTEQRIAENQAAALRAESTTVLFKQSMVASIDYLSKDFEQGSSRVWYFIRSQFVTRIMALLIPVFAILESITQLCKGNFLKAGLFLLYIFTTPVWIISPRHMKTWSNFD